MFKSVDAARYTLESQGGLCPALIAHLLQLYRERVPWEEINSEAERYLFDRYGLSEATQIIGHAKVGLIKVLWRSELGVAELRTTKANAAIIRKFTKP